MSNDRIKDTMIAFAEIVGDYLPLGEERVEEELRRHVAEENLTPEELHQVILHPDMFSGDGWSMDEARLIANVCGVDGYPDLRWVEKVTA